MNSGDLAFKLVEKSAEFAIFSIAKAGEFTAAKTTIAGMLSVGRLILISGGNGALVSSQLIIKEELATDTFLKWLYSLVRELAPEHVYLDWEIAITNRQIHIPDPVLSLCV